MWGTCAVGLWSILMIRAMYCILSKTFTTSDSAYFLQHEWMKSSMFLHYMLYVPCFCLYCFDLRIWGEHWKHSGDVHKDTFTNYWKESRFSRSTLHTQVKVQIHFKVTLQIPCSLWSTTCSKMYLIKKKKGKHEYTEKCSPVMRNFCYCMFLFYVSLWIFFNANLFCFFNSCFADRQVDVLLSDTKWKCH